MFQFPDPKTDVVAIFKVFRPFLVTKNFCLISVYMNDIDKVSIFVRKILETVLGPDVLKDDCR